MRNVPTSDKVYVTFLTAVIGRFHTSECPCIKRVSQATVNDFAFGTRSTTIDLALYKLLTEASKPWIKSSPCDKLICPIYIY